MIEKDILSKIKPGAIVRVWEKIKEGEKERLSAFEGIVLKRSHGLEPGATFTVRVVLQEIGVEKIYPIYSPNIEKVEILNSPKKIHKAKLYYLRTLPAKKVKEKMKKILK